MKMQKENEQLSRQSLKGPARSPRAVVAYSFLAIWQELKNVFLRALDLHFRRTDNFVRFRDLRSTRTPIEILMIFCLRELRRLANPVVDHPLMESPFECLPERQPPVAPDEMMQGTLKRATGLNSTKLPRLNR